MNRTTTTSQQRTKTSSSRIGVAAGLVLVGALAGCGGSSAKPGAKCRERQSEAIRNLESIVVSQQAWLMGNQKPSSSLRELGALLKGTGYTYTLVVDGDRWYAEATGVGEQKGDVWRADEASRATNTVALCASLR